jgi:glycosyltransferase involved in cell wall biosynthesis
MPKNILSIERTDSARELAKIYTAADVFVNLTYDDTYPTVNLEAQACGAPCLTYRTGGSTESVPSENVTEQGDLEAMVKRIQEICETE